MTEKRSATAAQRERALAALEELRTLERVLADEFGTAVALPALMDTVRTIREAERLLGEVRGRVPVRKHEGEE